MARNALRLALTVTAALAAMHMANAAWAQDATASPSDAAIVLAQGFEPDPRVVELEAGGSLDVSTLSTACEGYIATAPNVRLDYSGVDAPLIISASSSSDLSLFVVTPNGAWYCDADSGEQGGNPAVRFDRPQTGAYLIWVGASTEAEAELQLSTSQSR